VEDKERAGNPKLVEDIELEALLNGDTCQTQEELSELLGVARSILIFTCLKALEMKHSKAKKLDTVLIETNETRSRNLERRFVTCKQFLQRQKRKGFFHRIVTYDEKWIHCDNPKRKRYEVSPAMYQHPRQSRISVAPSLCSIFGEISRM